VTDVVNADPGSATDIDALFRLQTSHRWVTSRSSAAERSERLRRLRDVVARRADDAAEALYEDLRKPRERPMMRELARVLHYLDDAIEHVGEWMEPERLPPGPDGTESYVRYEARGVCLLFGPWNFPYQLTLGPLVPMIAAGNTAIVKPNEMTPDTSRLIAEIVREACDPAEVAVVEGGVDLANRLLDLPFDHIFLTGSPAVGRVVMSAAAKHLASVTLELGGKCPAVVDASTDVALAASQIGRGKAHNAGQVCLAPDHVWVHEDVRDEFVAAYLAWTKDHLYENGELNLAKCSRIVNERNRQRLQSYVEDAATRGARALTAGGQSPDDRFLAPVVLLDVPVDAAVMQDEIFGPILPVLSWSDRSEVIDYLRSSPKPLAMYVFTEDRGWADELIDQSSSGGVTVNGWATHFYDARLPFGGVGTSGMGRYHGRYGFTELSNIRSVVAHPTVAYGGLATDG
jgi:aldehyde dehydrogenase (NAD+)